MSKTIGIIGGMGPLAGADLLEKIIRVTEAKTDGEHIPVFLHSNTAIPDRTAAILSNGPSPVKEIVRSALALESVGAEVLAMACNTAHYFYEEITAFLHVELIHMPRETALAAADMGYKKAALLATDGTARSGVYTRAFEDTGVSLLLPDGGGQAAVMDMIYRGVKAGASVWDTRAVLAAMRRLGDLGAELFILGCTELPIAFTRFGIEAKTLDPTMVLAKKAVVCAGGKLKDAD
ncbi:MAG: amino acid racemase [Clostridiaceae bacterium]|nr:amino acid racemase [Eubacteriales bacterium]